MWCEAALLVQILKVFSRYSISFPLLIPLQQRIQMQDLKMSQVQKHSNPVLVRSQFQQLVKPSDTSSYAQPAGAQETPTRPYVLCSF
jgi:hypothetical protein